MNRRSFLSVTGCVLSALSWSAYSLQQRTYRIGYLHPTDAQDVAAIAFRQTLRDYGYVVGQNTILEERYAETNIERLPALAAELVANRVDVIVAVSPTAIRAARAATTTIPIVMAFSGDDPVNSGFAATLARPGGNITGLTTVALDMAPKWLELLIELAPGLKTVAVLRSPGRVDHTAQIEAIRAVADARGIRLQTINVRGVDEYAEAFDAIAAAGSQAVIVLNGPEFVHNRFRLVGLVMKHRLPSAYQFVELVTIGGLVSYGPNIAELSARSVAYVDKILKGANPAELPIEQPRKLFLVINRKTATALGLTVSPALLLQADQVIQ
ncbi:MAG TPA: ABC transporter substrate-binding protein [Casimicrobiaceae bacterium]|jgi:putative ABC transport system substrate-binding protein